MILSWPRWRGCTGSTQPGCTAPFTTPPPSNTRPSTTVRSIPDSCRCRDNPPSTKPGAVQFGAAAAAGFFGAVAGPFVFDGADGQPQQFDHRVVVWEVAAVFDDLAELVVQRL